MRRAFFSPPEFTYDRDQVVGRGGFGEVCLGTLTDTKTPVCVKITKDAYDDSFEREFELLAKLKGKDAIIQTHGFFDGGSFRCIVLEKADGALEHLLNLPRHSLGLPVHTVLDLVGDLAKALTALFDTKIAHRDIKPNNILYFTVPEPARIGNHYTFKLCDFGVSRTVGGMEQTFQTAGGTDFYMAPQSIAHYLRVDTRKQSMNAEKSDLWSLGITLFRCVTGRFPFHPRPFRLESLLKMITARPNEDVISYRNGAYKEKLHSIIHPKWFLETMTVMIRLLLNQRHSENIALLMAGLSELRSRIVYNLRMNVFYINHPHLDEKHMWFLDKWQLHAESIGIEANSRACMMNEGSEVRFLGTDDSDHHSLRNKETMTWKRQPNESWQREPKHAAPSNIDIIPGSFLIVCERPLDRMRAAPLTVCPIELEQIDENFDSLSSEVCAAIAHYDLLMLEEFIDNVHRISTTISNQREAAIKRLKAVLDLGQGKPNSELRDRAVTTFRIRTPDEFRMVDDLQEAYLVVASCMGILDDVDDRRNTIKAEEIKRMKHELIAATKYIVSAQRSLQEAIVRHCHQLMSSLRRIVEFNEVAENLEAEFEGRAPPHDLSFVDHSIGNADLRYEPPPGNAMWEVARPGSLHKQHKHSTTSSGYSSANSSIQSTDTPIFATPIKSPFIDKPKKAARKDSKKGCKVS